MPKVDMQTSKKTIKQWLRMRKQLNFDLAIQRNEDVWNDETKSLFIHSILFGYPVPALYSVEQTEFDGEVLDKSQYYIIDGKQRLTNIEKYINGEFALTENTPNITIVTDDGEKEYEIAGKMYNELPEELRDEILSYNLSINILKNVESDDVEEIFFRLNSGVPLTKMELTRAKAGNELMVFISKIAKMDFFIKSVNLTKNMRKRFVDQEIVLQILMYLIDGSPDFSGKNIQQFVIDMKKRKEIREEIKESIKEITEYLYKAIPNTMTELRKVHIPMIFITAQEAMENNIAPEKFGGWLQMFFKTKPYEYDQAARISTAKPDNVQKRIDLMLEHYQENIENASNYEAPVPKGTTGRRGRPAKNQIIEQQTE